MNAPQRKMMNVRWTRAAARIALCLGAGAALSGCAPGNPFATGPVDPSSPVAAEVTKAVRSNRAYPTFAQIPPAPTDVRPVEGWASAVGDVKSARADLDRQTAPQTWTLQRTEAFAASAQAAVGQDDGPAAREGDTEAFTRRSQERATPPPPPR
jgi:hypothetical protein